jgi:hypothetical protein
VVYGKQKRRKGGAFERISGAIFYKIFRRLTGINQPDNIVTARLMTNRYTRALLSHRERELNIGGLWIVTGFKQVSLIGWDSEMIEYPFVFDHAGERYMLYNGNGYGKSGFGLAILNA